MVVVGVSSLDPSASVSSQERSVEDQWPKRLEFKTRNPAAVCHLRSSESSTGLDQTSEVYGIFDDAAGLFGGDSALGNFNTRGSAEISNYEIFYSATRYCSRCSYEFRYNYTDTDYESGATIGEISQNIAAIDDTQQSVYASYTHRLNRNLRATISGTWRNTEFDGVSEDQEETRP